MGNNETFPCVELRNLAKTFSSVVAVDHINMQVKHGEVFSLLGSSGCGKTTTLRIIAGLEAADEGEVLIEGKVVNNVPPYKRDCNLVFQNLALFPHMTIAGNIAYGLERKKVPRDEIKRRVHEMLVFMRLEGVENRYPAQLSGGQQQRIALARSLVLRPKILLLDEPLSGLDRKLRKEMQTELKRIQQEVGITFFYVTHDQKVALAISDTIAVMRDGRLEQVGSPEEIYNTPRTTFVASFMGAVNIFPGKIITSGGREIQLESDSGLRVIALADEKTRCEDIEGICVHPERVNVLPSGAPVEADNRFRGRIVEMIYQGNFVEMKVCLLRDGTDEIITAHLDARLVEKDEHCVGKEVIVHWDPESSNPLQG
jgi:spermidine/putrescine transport system ATP-binding protein